MADTVVRHTDFVFEGEEYRVTDLELTCTPDDGVMIESLGLIEMWVGNRRFPVMLGDALAADFAKELAERYMEDEGEINDELRERAQYDNWGL